MYTHTHAYVQAFAYAICVCVYVSSFNTLLRAERRFSCAGKRLVVGLG